MTTAEQIRNLYLGSAELKRITGWPDIVIELLTSLAESVIITSNAVDANDIAGNIYPVLPDEPQVIDFQPLAPSPIQWCFDFTPSKESALTQGVFVPSVALGSMADQDKDRVDITGGSIAGAHSSADLSLGISTTITAADLAGKTIVVKDGIITSFS